VPARSSILGPILHLDDATSWRGGQQQVLYLHQGLRAADVDSRVVCRQGSALHERLLEERLPHYALEHMSAHDLVVARTLARIVGDHPQSILHAHTSHAHELALWAHRLGARSPVVVSRRVDFPVARTWWSGRKYRSRRVSRYLAISSAVEQELRRAGIEDARIRRVPSGIDLTRFENLEPDHDWKRSLGLEPGELLFGSIAALADHKDQSTLLRAFARFRDRGGSGRLVVIGEGELRGPLEAQRRELGLDDVVSFPGFTHDVLPRLAAFDIFVLTSKKEGLGTSILDAMAAGRPVLATRAGGIVDAVVDGESGRLCPVGAVDAIADTMVELQASAALRQRLAHGARQRVKDFDVRSTVERTRAAYAEILEDPAGS